jgi:hypothetical protein
MGSALTQAHIENQMRPAGQRDPVRHHGAILGVDEDDYPGIIAQLQAFPAGPWRLLQDIQACNAESHPNLNAPSCLR